MKKDRFFNPRATPLQTRNRIEKENQMTTYNYAKGEFCWTRRALLTSVVAAPTFHFVYFYSTPP